MEESSFAGSIRRFQREKTDLYAAFALSFYTVLVYVWSLTIHPMGPDYAAMAAPEDAMPAVAAWVFRGKMAVFGGWAFPYHVVNVGLLYVCAVLVYRLGREVIDGPAWLSLLAAVFYMANPVHRDAAFLISGAGASLPAFAGLLGVYLGIRAWRLPTAGPLAMAVAVLAVAALVFPSNRWTPIPVLLAGWLLPPRSEGETRPLTAWVGFGAVLVAAMFRYGVGELAGAAYDPASMWTALYFALYPLGFLPETVREFHQREWLAWLTAGIAVAAFVLIMRKSKSRVVVWAVVSALAVRVGLGEDSVEFVHLLGGRHLLVANAFVLIALCAVLRAMIRHPKWHRPVVTGTTLWCLILFGMQIYTAFVWRDVGKEVKAFQARMATERGQVGLLPDFGFYHSAPAFFGESVRHKTPFSPGTDAVSLVVLNVDDEEDFSFSSVSYTPKEALMEIRCNDLGYALGSPYTVDARETDRSTVGLLDATAEGGKLVIRPKDGVFPKALNRPYTRADLDRRMHE